MTAYPDKEAMRRRFARLCFGWKGGEGQANIGREGAKEAEQPGDKMRAFTPKGGKRVLETAHLISSSTSHCRKGTNGPLLRWEVACLDMNQIYRDVLPETVSSFRTTSVPIDLRSQVFYFSFQETGRVARLELFDEFEEWHLIQSHYAVCLSVGVLMEEKDKRVSGDKESDGIMESPFVKNIHRMRFMEVARKSHDLLSDDNHDGA